MTDRNSITSPFIANENSLEYIALPDGKRHYVPKPTNKIARHYTDHPMHSSYAKQYPAERDENRGYILMPLLGSGFDNAFLAAITKGTMRNSGLTPVIDGEASSVVARLQMMTHDWVVSFKSTFLSPMKRFADFIAMAEGGEGVKEFSSNMVGGVFSQNSGHIWAQLPFHMPLETWSDWGASIIPILDETGRETNRYRFSIDDVDFATNRALWTLDNLQVDPTGDSEFPIWVRKQEEDGDEKWILIHKDYAAQEIRKVGHRQYDLAGWSPCPIYIYFGDIGVMNAMVTEYNYEAFFNAPPEGMVVLTGADADDQLADIMVNHLEERINNKSLYYPGSVWVSIKNTNGKVFFVPFKQPPEGFDNEKFIARKQRLLALAFGLSLNFVTLEIGVGAVHQAAVTDMIAEITGISYIRSKIEHILNHKLAPPRVITQVSIPSSAAKSQQAQTFNEATDAIKKMQEAGAALSVNQVRRLTEKIAGITIPEDVDGDRSADDTQDSTDIRPVEEESIEVDGLSNLVEHPCLIQGGTRVITGSGLEGEILKVNSDGVWVTFEWDKEFIPVSSHPYKIYDLWVKNE